MKIVLLLLIVLPAWGAVINISPDQSIQQAIESSSDADTILLEPGTYVETVILRERFVTIASRYLLSLDTNDIHNTVWRPDQIRPDTNCCLLVSNQTTHNSLISGITFSNGLGARGRDNSQPIGGAILVERSNLRIEHCIIRNSTAHFGGGIAAHGGQYWDPRGHLQVSECEVVSCLATGWGGGIYANTCSLTVENTILSNNTSISDGGGLIALDCISDISNSRFDSCRGVTGGVHVAGKRSRISYCEFTNNGSTDQTFWATHFSNGVGKHEVMGSYFGRSASLSRGFNFCCGGDTIVFVGNIVENIVATSPFGTGNFAIGGVSGELAYNIVRNNRTRGEQIFPLGGTTIDIHHNIFSDNVSDFADRPSVLKIGQDPNQTFHDNAIVGNSGQTIGYTTDPGVIDARNNWWGSETGPYHPTRNPFGQGDTILSDSVLFDPWLLSPPDTTNSISPPHVAQPSTWEIVSLYPNPFNSELSIAIAGILSPSFSLKLYDLLGREVATLSEGRGHGAMIHYTAPQTLATGVYFVRAADATSIETRKIVFLK